jgi:hypothetical protein
MTTAQAAAVLPGQLPQAGPRAVFDVLQVRIEEDA